MTSGGLGPAPKWAADDADAVDRWEALGRELRLPYTARPAAEVWLAAWCSLQAAREVNKWDGAEQVPTAPLLAQTRSALVEVSKYTGAADEAGLRMVR